MREAFAPLVTGLFGNQVNLADLAKTWSVDWAPIAPGITGLFDAVAAGVQEQIETDPEASLEVAEVVELSLQEIDRMPPSEARKLDPIAVIGVILAIFFWFHGLHMAQGVEQMIEDSVDVTRDEGAATREHIDSLESTLQALVNLALASPSLTETVLETHSLSRDLHLRLGPSASSSSLRVFTAGTRVQSLLHASGWTQVALHDDVSDSVYVGWMFGRYLRRLD